MNFSLIELIIYFSGMLYILNSAVNLFEKNKTTVHYVFISLLFAAGIWQLYHGLMVSGILIRHPHLSLIHVPFLYLTAPLLYIFFKFLIQGTLVITRKSIIHLLPCVILTLLLVPFYLETPEQKLVLIQNPLNRSFEYPFYPQIIFLYIVAISVYLGAFIIRVMPLLFKKGLGIKNITFFSIVIIAINFSLVLLYLFAFIMVKLFNATQDLYFSLIKAISLIHALQICLLMIIKTRFYDYFARIKDEGQRIRYTSSRIEALDVHDVLDRLTRLMQADKIYCDEELTLKSLAQQLGISHYQLSQILNERLNKNFNTYVNEYRIREAEKLLLEEPERSVTNISYAVGFNTISSFYNSFSKMHNMSPAAMRKKKIKTK